MLENSAALPATDYQLSSASPTRSEDIRLERPQALMMRLTSRRPVLANAKANPRLRAATARVALTTSRRSGIWACSRCNRERERACYGHSAQAGVWFPQWHTSWVSVSRVPSAIANSANLLDSLLLVHLDGLKPTQRRASTRSACAQGWPTRGRTRCCSWPKACPRKTSTGTAHSGSGG
ncbi:hypothetical protein GmRootV59_54410 (plasmid) [Variovorax sp. V59]